MKRKGHKGLIIILGIGILLILASVVLPKLGIIENGTTYTEVKAAKTISDVDTLEDGHLYVWKDCKDKAIEGDNNDFLICPVGNTNLEYKDKNVSVANYTIWISSEDDYQIPTLTSEDKLIFVSLSEVPDTFTFLRMFENGYSIGITSLTADASEHYYLPYVQTDEKDYKQVIDVNSDANDLGGMTINKLYLDKVGDMEITAENISDGGIVLGLTKDEKYVCEFYTGTYYQDYLLSASQHTFTEFEEFTCYGYEFLHANCISIDIPEWLCSGYYYVNGVGLFRYVADSDVGTYNGKPYDENIAWNEPLILYDDFGQVVYDPSQEQYQQVEEENAGASLDIDTILDNSAVSTKGTSAKWSYTIENEVPLIIKIKLSKISNEEDATLIVEAPTGERAEYKESNNIITVNLEEPTAGAYAFNLKDIEGRTFDIKYSNGDTYSGSAEVDEPAGDDLEEITELE